MSKHKVKIAVIGAAGTGRSQLVREIETALKRFDIEVSATYLEGSPPKGDDFSHVNKLADLADKISVEVTEVQVSKSNKDIEKPIMVY